MSAPNVVLWANHQIHVSPLSGWVLPYPAGYDFPVPCGGWPSLLGSSSSHWRVPPPLRLAYWISPDSIGVSTFHTFKLGSGWVPSILRGHGVPAEEALWLDQDFCRIPAHVTHHAVFRPSHQHLRLTKPQRRSPVRSFPCRDRPDGSASVQRIIIRRALSGQHPTTPEEIITWLEDTVAAWNQDPTPFTWDGKRKERRDRARQRRLGGSCAVITDSHSNAA